MIALGFDRVCLIVIDSGVENSNELVKFKPY